MSKNEGGSAFPARWLQFYDRPGSPPGNTIIESPGMSLRAYIATHSLLTAAAYLGGEAMPPKEQLAKQAVEIADAVIAALEKPTDD